MESPSLLPSGCCRSPTVEVDRGASSEATVLPEQDFPIMVPAMLPANIEVPDADPQDLLAVLWRVQDQQLSSLDALRQLRSQHQEWHRSVQEFVRQVQNAVGPKEGPKADSRLRAGTSTSSKAHPVLAPAPRELSDEIQGSEVTEVISVQVPDDGAAPEEAISVSPTCDAATTATVTQDSMKPKETEHVVQTETKAGFAAPLRALFNQMQKPKAAKSKKKKIKRSDEHTLFPSEWQLWIDHLMEIAAQKPEFDGTAWAACRVYAYRVVSRRSFEHLVGFLIALNLILQGVETDLELREPDGSWSSFFTNVDIVFNTVYCLEIFLRFIAGGLGVLCDSWFLADTILVLLGVSASVFSVSGGSSARQFIVVRGLRLLRLGRAIRMTKKFKVMWHLVNGLLNSAQLMISVFMLLTLSIYIFACLGVELITKDEALLERHDTASIVDVFFPNLPLTMLTLIQFITLDSIGGIYFPIVRSKPILILYFLPILMILPITLMNLVTAVLVEHGLENAQLETAEENRNRARYIKKSVIELGELFEELDRDRNGQITQHELNLVPPDSVPKELLDVLFVDDLSDIFTQLDIDGTGELSKDEFVDGILQMITRDTPMETLQIMKLLQSLRTKVAAMADQLSQLGREDMDFQIPL